MIAPLPAAKKIAAILPNKRGGRKRRTSGLNKLQRKWISPPADRPWARLWVDMIEGAAWRGLSVNARRVLDALIAQHFRYGQCEKTLQISYLAFQKAGVSKNFIAPAIRELEAAGFVETLKGTPRIGLLCRPNVYRLTIYQPSGIVRDAARQFIYVPVEVLESPQWCALKINARRVLDRLLIENFRHCGKTNGDLRVSARQFGEWGINSRFVSDAVRKLVAAGFVTVKQGAKKGSQRPRIFTVLLS
jgi:DNA-binding IscR family transcriptional regulator